MNRFLICLIALFSCFSYVFYAKTYDVLIIGGGAAGLTAAMEVARAKYKVAIIAQEIGGQLNGSHHVENIPAVSAKPGYEIMADLQHQVADFGVKFIYDTVTDVDFSVKNSYKLTTQDHGLLEADSVIIATGSSPKKLSVPGEEEFWGKGVSSCAVCDCFLYQDKEVVIVGGGDSAVEEALQLAEYANKVTILVRGQQMRASAWGQEKLREHHKISIVYATEVVEIVGDDMHGVTGVMTRDVQTGAIKEFKTDGIFLAIGHTPNTDLVKKWLPLDVRGYIILTSRSQATTIPGLFAAGDVADPSYKKAYIAMGAGGQAGLEAVHYLRSHI
jgi:thioredoxin reductase (NADPH)